MTMPQHGEALLSIQPEDYVPPDESRLEQVAVINGIPYPSSQPGPAERAAVAGGPVPDTSAQQSLGSSGGLCQRYTHLLTIG